MVFWLIASKARRIYVNTIIAYLWLVGKNPNGNLESNEKTLFLMREAHFTGAKHVGYL